MSDRFFRARTRMIDQHLKARGIIDDKVLLAFDKIPRHKFVLEAFVNQAYSDMPLPIGEKQTISQPYVVAYMLEKIHLLEKDRVLELGTGSGYQTALLSVLVSQVYTIERIHSLSIRARKILESINCNNVVYKTGDGTLGWREMHPFDAIIVSAAAPSIPSILIEQLADNGRLIIPVGNDSEQELIFLKKTGQDIIQEKLGNVKFVPLIGKFGWNKQTV